ncbi:MAG TPA: DUF1232 domain-containing protein [Thermoanaerobaculia bacterium]|nr:DUF1232 domain-containing protein [Thermoanaerobaculia bacterium]
MTTNYESTTGVSDNVSDDASDEDVLASLHDGAQSGSSVSEERANRFYDRVRQNIGNYLETKGGAVGKTGEFLLLVPDIFILLLRLVNDAAVTGKNKVLLGSSIAYYLFPFDLLPEGFMGPTGYLDDLVFAVYVLHKILGDTDPEVVRRHWSGSEDVLHVIQRVLDTADNLVGSEMLGRFKKLLK